MGTCAVVVCTTAWALTIGFIDPAAPGEPGVQNAAALAWARTVGEVTRLRPAAEGSWETVGGQLTAPEEFDVVWYHQGDSASLLLSRANALDLLEYLQGGGALLLSGSAGALLREMGVEKTTPRVLGPATFGYVSGIVVREEHRAHPIFAGLDTSRPILLTSYGGNALADFYDTDGPTGTLLADGNAGVGERPLVEYKAGEGTALFVGWRLGDFTTAADPYRPNLERLYRNMLEYLAAQNKNRAVLVVPPGRYEYRRVLGVPFLKTDAPVELVALPQGMKYAEALYPDAEQEGSIQAGEVWVSEAPVQASMRVTALALTLTSRERPAAAFLAARRAMQAEFDARDRQMIGGLRVVKAQVRTIPAPLKPLKLVEPEQAVLFGRSPFMAPSGDIAPAYEPVEDGGFRISGSRRSLNRPILHGQNRVWTGDVPIFRMDTMTGPGCYSADKWFPLFDRPDAPGATVYPCLGTLRLGVMGAGEKVHWLDEGHSTTVFRPGYTSYEIDGPEGGWRAKVLVAPTMAGHGMVCRVEFDRQVPLVWHFGGLWWSGPVADSNRADIEGQRALLTCTELPKGLVVVGWDGDGEGRKIHAYHGDEVEFAASSPRRVYHIAATWGVTKYDEERARATMARLDTPAAAAWPEARDRLKRIWFEAYIGRALEPLRRFEQAMANPEAALQETVRWWDARRAEFQIRTPDPYLNALINWSRATTEYHRQGPGLILGTHYWIMYSHISTGWYGKEWGGDHQAMEECLRLYGAMQDEKGFVRWISPSLTPFYAENNTCYWVDQVWQHFRWTGDVEFLRDLWPNVRKAVEWMQKTNDPDGDGLFRDWYEYWNCDSNGKGPKAVTPSAMAWAAMDRAAHMAKFLGDAEAEAEYRALADKTRNAVLRELWREDKGRLGCVGADGIWRGHPQIWEEYLPIIAGLLDPEKGRRAMRWIEAHYGFEPQPGVKLLSSSDWWPIRWSCQWVPTGDTLLAALAGMKCGDADLWWPYVKTVIGAAFKSEFPGINMGISNAGAGGGDREDVDSVDPHVHCIVRGLFGIEPAVHEGRFDICPAFPSHWTKVSIRTPDISYEARKAGAEWVFRIVTPRPAVKHIRANLSGPEVVTKAERVSVVRVKPGPPPPPHKPAAEPTILREQAEIRGELKPRTITPAEQSKQVLFDLAEAYNVTPAEMVGTAFVYDYADGPAPVAGWWGNPGLETEPSPRMVEVGNGVKFLTAGRPVPPVAPENKSLLALSSWAPYPFPGGIVMKIGLRCRSLWLLLQNYVHPMKNYIPNGEVVLRYADGHEEVKSLVPPYNLDCYFSHFSLEGTPVKFGRLSGEWSFVVAEDAHADALEVKCDPSRLLKEVEVRATCSEGIIGLAGLTAVEAPGPE